MIHRFFKRLELKKEETNRGRSMQNICEAEQDLDFPEPISGPSEVAHRIAGIIMLYCRGPSSTGSS